ncbi:MAG: hypothetical protein KDI43_01185 [Gammaproteobacteria bacterium]|nr:hypothetical protein [Gammaproteobacteria bacterium]
MLDNTTDRPDADDLSPHGDAAIPVVLISVGTNRPTAANLSTALARRGKHVCLITTGTPSGGKPLLPGQNRESTLEELLARWIPLAEALFDGAPAPDTQILPAGDIFANFYRLQETEQSKLVELLVQLESVFDFIVVDAANETNDGLRHLCQSAPLILLTITPEADSLTSAFSLLRAIKREYKNQPIHIIVDLAENLPHAHDSFKRLQHAASKYLQIEPHYLGHFTSSQPQQGSSQRNLNATKLHPDTLTESQTEAIADRFCAISETLIPSTCLSRHFGELCFKRKKSAESDISASVRDSKSTEVQRLTAPHIPGGWHDRLSDRIALFDAIHFASMLGERESQQ